ncbi:DUF58 domain-containing protein [Dyella sp.]|uniref:DUF58 domain-containing protein n=1 Tax=Dyella sp. TaxID=1869338 RepID=UPI002ED03F24
MRPGPALLLLLLAWTALGVAVGTGQVPLSVWLAFGAACLVIALLDAWLLSRLPSPVVTRELPPVVPLVPEWKVGLRVHAAGARVQVVDLHDLHPGEWPVRGMPRRLRLEPRREVNLDYAVSPGGRGQFQFPGCQIRLRSPLRGWTQQRIVGHPSVLRVYPNFAPLAEMAGLSVEVASRSVGARLQRRRGDGTEFQELREYRIGDSLRKIDWKATARMGRPISREYRDERNQQVILLLDGGRRMLAQDDRLSHFDHVLNASLALAYIALRQGDAVGMLSCSGQDMRWLPPQQGNGGMDMLLGAGYDLQAQPVATDYVGAASALQLHQRRRAFVVLITNVRDEDDEELRMAVSLLSRRHLVLVVSLRETALDESIGMLDESVESAVRSASVMHYLAQRQAMHDKLQREGVAVLDVTCGELSGRLIERYLAAKRDGRL